MSRVVLISGITGQDGSCLAELLLAKRCEVSGMIRRPGSLDTGRIDHLYRDPDEGGVHLKLIHGDLGDSSSIWRALSEVKPDEVYNLGAQRRVPVSF